MISATEEKNTELMPPQKALDLYAAGVDACYRVGLPIFGLLVEYEDQGIGWVFKNARWYSGQMKSYRQCYCEELNFCWFMPIDNHVLLIVSADERRELGLPCCRIVIFPRHPLFPLEILLSCEARRRQKRHAKKEAL